MARFAIHATRVQGDYKSWGYSFWLGDNIKIITQAEFKHFHFCSLKFKKEGFAGGVYWGGGFEPEPLH